MMTGKTMKKIENRELHKSTMLRWCENNRADEFNLFYWGDDGIALCYRSTLQESWKVHWFDDVIRIDYRTNPDLMDIYDGKETVAEYIGEANG